MVRNLMLAALTFAAMLTLGNTAFAQTCIGVFPHNGQSQGYYSGNLKANLHIRSFYLPPYGHFTAARIVSLAVDSPLRNADLVAGDVITRLDGVQIHNYAELDLHADDTVVRFIKSEGRNAMSKRIYIPSQTWGCYPNVASSDSH